MVMTIQVLRWAVHWSFGTIIAGWRFRGKPLEWTRKVTRFIMMFPMIKAKKRGIQLRNVTKIFWDTPKYPKLSLFIFEYLPIRYSWFLCIYPKCHIGSWYSHTILMMMTFHTLPRSILARNTKAQVTSLTLSGPNSLSVSGGWRHRLAKYRKLVKSRKFLRITESNYKLFPK